MALCRAGCGFYGNEAFAGMCSVCFKKQTPSTRIENVPAPAEQSFQLNARDLSVDIRVGNEAGSEETADTDTVTDDNIDLSALMQRLGTEDMSSFVGFEKSVDFENNPHEDMASDYNLTEVDYEDMAPNVGSEYNMPQNEINEEEVDMYSEMPWNEETHSETDVTSTGSTKQLTEATEVEKSEQKSLCRAECGFYSNFGLDGLCSVCFKKEKLGTPSKSISVVEHKPTVSAPKSITSSATAASATACSTPQEEQSEAAGAAEVDEGKGKRKKNRCITCRKNVGLLGFACRCKGLFCGEHRYSDKHDCTFDYKALGKEQLEKQMNTGGVTRKFKVNDI